MAVANIVALIDASARLISALAWPIVFVFALTILRPALHDFRGRRSQIEGRGL
jgi:cytochrome bd-type quinol oxidase subunit 2